MKKVVPIVILFFLVWGCSSSRLVNDWKSPETDVFEANKVLVIGLAENVELRRQFEEELTVELEKNKVVAVRSIDFFENSFTDEKRSEEELNQVEARLLEAGFDAILFSKVIGVEDKVTTIQSMRDLTDAFQTFKEDYYQSQDIYYTKNAFEHYKLYHAETSLYCICPGKERELLWTGNIDIVENQNRTKSVRDYIKTLISVLQDKQLLIVDL